ncbi:MAG: hypothetical protein HYR88_05855 [Verrucomicrobia bacterium]|nr:hypothetical protein [Verrucomicrobiota bacterium]MBI3869046.1 hypothetical protein [Verrucomicrobiota bacterium]
MAWQHLQQFAAATAYLQKGLSRGRLAHAYLFTGEQMEPLEAFGRTLAKAVNCENPPRRSESGLGLDSCDACLSCRKIDGAKHPDMHWLRAESKMRQIRTEQMTELLRTVFLKPNEARYKVCFIVAAERMNAQAANKFLKTLEEPPADSLLLLLSTAPEQVIETIRSRCQRIQLFNTDGVDATPGDLAWLEQFGVAAASDQGGLLDRYRLLSVLLRQLAELKSSIAERLESESMLEKVDDLEPEFRKRLEDELAASTEAEYRRQRAELLGTLQWWLRDVWLQTMGRADEHLRFPQLQTATAAIARRLDPDRAVGNLTEVERTLRLLNTNVQEALALEVGLLKLRL